MTQLLVSVRSAAEAQAALAGGADWIDLKEPAHGPLGAVAAEVARQTAASVNGRAALSAAAGELLDWPTASARELLRVPAMTHLKLGLSGCGDDAWEAKWRAAQREIAAAGKELVAVSYADWQGARSPTPSAVAELAFAASCRWLLIDTFDKRGGSLLDWMTVEELTAIFQLARQRHVASVAAGKLSPAEIRRLPRDLVDVVAVRSAACGGDRSGTVKAESVAALRELLDASENAPLRR